MRAPAHPGGKPTSRSRRTDPIMQAWDSNELRTELQRKTEEFLKLLDWEFQQRMHQQDLDHD
jgi:hypothetical protein